MPIVKEKKLNFELQAFLDYEKERINKLSLNDIQDVKGGISIKPLLKAGGIMSVLFLGADLGNSTQVHANTPIFSVTSSTYTITRVIKPTDQAGIENEDEIKARYK